MKLKLNGKQLPGPGIIFWRDLWAANLPVVREFLAKCRLEFIKVRYNGLEDIHDWPTSSKSYDRRFYDAKLPYCEQWLYKPSVDDVQWFRSADMAYLKALVEKPMHHDLFLQEMTPNASHNGESKGLMISDPFHQELQKKFARDVEKICIEKGLSHHPAWVIKCEPKPEEEIKQLRLELAKLRANASASQKQFEARIAEIEQEKVALQNENKILRHQRIASPPQTRQRKGRAALERVWYGKYHDKRVPMVYAAHGPKPGGCAIGYVVCVTDHPHKRYIAKLGLPDDAHAVSQTMSTRRRNFQRSILSVITEFVATDVYALLGQGIYYVPKHRLSYLQIITEYTKDNPLAIAVVQGMKAQGKEAIGLHILSRLIDEYRDIHSLENCKFYEGDETSLPFMDCLHMGHVPQFAEIEGQWVPIIGLMEILAASRLLADTDVLGGGGKNTGYVIERDSNEQPVAVRAVKIDAGEAFNFSSEMNQFMQSFNPLTEANKLKDLRDMQIGNNQPLNIQWSRLSPKQKACFLSALKRGLDVLSDQSLIEYLIHRGGLFNKAIPDRVLLTDAITRPFKESWKKYRDAQCLPQVYGNMMLAIETPSSSLSVPFHAKDFGAMTCNVAMTALEAAASNGSL